MGNEQRDREGESDDRDVDRNEGAAGSESRADRLITLRSMPPMEAAPARVKLEQEGIPAVVDGDTISVMRPLLFPNARLRVYESDAQRAEEILSRPAPPDGQGEYVDEP